MRRIGKKSSGPARPGPSLAAEIEAEAQAELQRVAQQLSERTGVPPPDEAPAAAGPSGPPGASGPPPAPAVPVASREDPGRPGPTGRRVRKRPPGKGQAGGDPLPATSATRPAPAGRAANGGDGS